MFETETTLNRFLMSGLDSVVADVPAERMYEKSPGNGHPPVWVLGHLAICAELGQQLLGGSVTHVRWLPLFGPGSSDDVQPHPDHSMDEFLTVIREGYPRLCEMARTADSERLNQPHGVQLLEGSGVETVHEIVAHLLTSHFGFHLAQLSGWRRAAGHGPLF